NNTATSSYNNGAAVVTGSSNTVPFTVTQQASVTMTPPAAIATAAPGSTISFANLLTNTGNGTDTFNLAIGTSSFPVGTTFQIFKSDGATPLVDTNGDSVIDTGPVLAGGTYSVILKATLPLNASGGPFSVSKSATSVFNSAATATATDTLTAMTAATVDLRNTDTLGAGAGTETTIVTNVATAGGTTSFTLLAYNTGASADSYNLSAGSTAAMAALPAGWSVSFRAGSCPSTGATVTNTGSVAAAPAFGAVCAVVNVPAGAAAGTTDLYFRVLSPTSGATDYIRDAVTINVVRSLTIGNPGSGQVFPGGIVVYPHTLTNTGNAAENGSLSTISLTSSNSASSTGWTSSLYYDSNSNGVLDSGDPQITSSLSAAGYGGSLAPGASITIFDRVMAPSGAAVGASNSTTVTVSTLNGSYTSAVPATVTVADRTTVIAGNLTLTKAQAVNTACSNTPGSYTAANLSAAPNQCVDYRITVTNIGSADATTVVISDATPAFTTMSTAAVLTPAGTIVQPIVGSGGTVTATVGTLAPGASAVLTFSVRITP
ncbi:MAG: DUF11 domain-containing protein, partial [Polaromonas sp.]|nr:DUF11 domain-containing protein [Polaromonas sp.]